MQVYYANNFFKRLKGLLGKTSIDRDEFWIFDKTAWVHTMGMRFSIAVFYFDRNGCFIKEELLKPNKIAKYVQGAYYVVESHPCHLGCAKKIGGLIP